MLAFIGRISDLELALYIAVGAVLLMWFSIILWSIFSTSYREWKKDREQIAEKDNEILELNNKKNAELEIVRNRIKILQNHIKTYSETPDPNVTLVDAVYYVAFGKWGVEKLIDDDGNFIDIKASNKLLVAIDNIKHKARSFELIVWGYDIDKNGNPLYDEIKNPPEYWRKYWPNLEVFIHNEADKTDIGLIFDQQVSENRAYNWYFTDKRIVEKLWPPENILA